MFCGCPWSNNHCARLSIRWNWSDNLIPSCHTPIHSLQLTADCYHCKPSIPYALLAIKTDSTTWFQAWTRHKPMHILQCSVAVWLRSMNRCPRSSSIWTRFGKLISSLPHAQIQLQCSVDSSAGQTTISQFRHSPVVAWFSSRSSLSSTPSLQLHGLLCLLTPKPFQFMQLLPYSVSPSISWRALNNGSSSLSCHLWHYATSFLFVPLPDILRLALRFKSFSFLLWPPDSVVPSGFFDGDAKSNKNPLMMLHQNILKLATIDL